MTKKKRCSLVIVALVQALAAATLIGGSSSGDDTAVESLNAVRSLYAQVETVTLSAVAELSVHEKESQTRRGQATFFYQADGNRYFASSRSDASLGLMRDFDVAYDGEHYQLLLAGEDKLILHREDRPIVPSVIQNPLFLPVTFLTPRDDSCRGCSVRLVDARSDSRWKARIAQASFVAYDESRRSSPILRFPGVSFSGDLAQVEVTFAEAGQIGSIRQIGPRGSTEVLYEFSDYRDAGTDLAFPHRIRVTVASPSDGSLWVEQDIVVQELAINAGVDPAVFTIPRDAAPSIWDGDRNEPWAGQDPR